MWHTLLPLNHRRGTSHQYIQLNFPVPAIDTTHAISPLPVCHGTYAVRVRANLNGKSARPRTYGTHNKHEQSPSPAPLTSDDNLQLSAQNNLVPWPMRGTPRIPVQLKVGSMEPRPACQNKKEAPAE